MVKLYILARSNYCMDSEILKKLRKSKTLFPPVAKRDKILGAHLQHYFGTTPDKLS
jgi:hypothetical protein